MTRPLRAVEAPHPFVQGALTGVTEELIRAGYDTMGTTLDPEDEDEILLSLEALNQRRPGTAGIHLTFLEAPTLVGLGYGFALISLTVYGPGGELLLERDLDPPGLNLVLGFLLPPRRPEAAGRNWIGGVWQEELSRVFGRRGPER